MGKKAYLHTYDFSHFKNRCVCCERSGIKLTKEHVFPEWLLKRTNTHERRIRWINGKRIRGKHCTLPICSDCNAAMGLQLEAPVRVLFDDIEGGRGLSEQECELICQWMWKMTGIFWWAAHPDGKFSLGGRTLRQHVLQPIATPRSRVSLAIGRIGLVDYLRFGDAPMGLDVLPDFCSILAAGVFSKVALIVHLSEFSGDIPRNYSIYTFSDNPSASPKVFFPSVGFYDDTEAVGTTTVIARRLKLLHDRRGAQALATTLQDAGSTWASPGPEEEEDVG